MRAYRTELNVTPTQARKIRSYCGVARFSYNWYINCAIAYYRECKQFLTANDFAKVLTHSDRPDWFLAAPSKAVKQAIRNAEKAFKQFFKGQSGFPQFKRKGTQDSYYNIGAIHAQRHRIRLPKLGWVKLKEYGFIPTDQHIISATVSIDHGRYFVSCLVDMEIQPLPESHGEVLGIDVGIKDFAILSDGTVFTNINKDKRVKKLEKRCRRLQRQLSRQYEANKTRKGEVWRNFERTKLRKSSVERRLMNIRVDYVNKVVHEIIERQPSSITMEHLHVQGLLKNHHMAHALQTVGLATLLSKLTSKAREMGIEVRQVSQWYPSSKTCHECGFIKQDLTLKDRTWTCEQCGHTHDRDVNAALNLRDTTQYRVVAA